MHKVFISLHRTFVFDPSGRFCYLWELVVSLAYVSQPKLSKLILILILNLINKLIRKISKQMTAFSQFSPALTESLLVQRFLYNFWVIIYRVSFEEISSETMAVWLSIDSMADFIYLIDIGVHFRTAYLGKCSKDALSNNTRLSTLQALHWPIGSQV